MVSRTRITLHHLVPSDPPIEFRSESFEYAQDHVGVHLDLGADTTISISGSTAQVRADLVSLRSAINDQLGRLPSLSLVPGDDHGERGL